jgi:hypothetical protein
MYLPSNTPILQDQREAAALHGAQSDARIAAMRRTSACGRVRLFNTLINPNSVADGIGMGTALDTAKLQAQTEASRASGILAIGGSASAGGPSAAEIIAGAPEVVSLNRGGGCSTPSYQPMPLGPDPQPGMPQRAPIIVQGPDGPMHYLGADATYQGYPTGLTGYAPPWSDAGVLPNGGIQDVGVGGWLMDHPWLALLLAGGGVYALSRRNKAGR